MGLDNLSAAHPLRKPILPLQSAMPVGLHLENDYRILECFFGVSHSQCFSHFVFTFLYSFCTVQTHLYTHTRTPTSPREQTIGCVVPAHPAFTFPQSQPGFHAVGVRTRTSLLSEEGQACHHLRDSHGSGGEKPSRAGWPLPFALGSPAAQALILQLPT